MHRPGFKPTILAMVLALGTSVLLLSQQTAQALPSYARQTGMACNLCHTLFPELTAFGRTFKASGYTLSQMKKIQSPPDRKPGSPGTQRHLPFIGHGADRLYQDR